MTRKSKLRHPLPFPPPRLAVLLPAVRRFRLLLLVALLLSPPLVLIVGSWRLQELHDLTTVGRQTEGTILSRESFSNVRRGTKNRVRYSFEVSGQTLQDQEENVTSQEFTDYDEGVPCVVTYLPGQPEIHCLGLAASRLADGTLMTFFLAAIVFLLILAIAIAKEVGYRRELYRARHWETCTGRVVDLRTLKQYRSKPLHEVHYRFQRNEGRYEGWNVVPHAAWMNLSREDPVTVLIDPTNPKDHVMLIACQQIRLVPENVVAAN